MRIRCPGSSSVSQLNCINLQQMFLILNWFNVTGSLYLCEASFEKENAGKEEQRGRGSGQFSVLETFDDRCLVLVLMLSPLTNLKYISTSQLLVRASERHLPSLGAWLRYICLCLAAWPLNKHLVVFNSLPISSWTDVLLWRVKIIINK